MKRLAHICFVVRDLDRSMTFYRDMLGFEEAFAFRDESDRWIGQYLHVGGGTFIELFSGAPSARDAAASYQHFCVEVEDIEAQRERLTGLGVEMSETKLGRDGSLQAWLTDPDGNRIELHQYTPDSKQNPWAGR